jgi:hypothetical protein
LSGKAMKIKLWLKGLDLIMWEFNELS